jgi:hypothetical protein
MIQRLANTKDTKDTKESPIIPASVSFVSWSFVSFVSFVLNPPREDLEIELGSPVDVAERLVEDPDRGVRFPAREHERR